MKYILKAILILMFFLCSRAFSEDCSEMERRLISCEVSETECYSQGIQSTVRLKILGMEDGKCVFLKIRLGGGIWKCKASESAVLALIKYLKSFEIQHDENGDIKEPSKNLSYVVDGKETNDFFGDIFRSGICVVVGPAPAEDESEK